MGRIPVKAVVPEHVKVVSWRVEELRRAGCPAELADKIASDRSIDLHKAVDVVKAAGPELAAEILL